MVKFDNLLSILLPEDSKKWQWRNGVWLFCSLVIFLLDQSSKQWASKTLLHYDPLTVFNGFDLNLAHNFGASFSFLNYGPGPQRYVLIAITGLISLLLLLYLFRVSTKRYYLLFGISLILGGAFGNLYDRIAYGYVIDFISLYYRNWYWPTFNIADTAICIGAFILICLSVRSD